MDAVAWSLAGAGVGAASGLLPGVHVNTVCAVALATAPVAPGPAIGLAAAAGAHLFTSLLPSTYLGVPGEDAALGALPAHRFTQRGRGPDAIRLGVRATLAGLLVATALLLPHKWLIAEPGGLLRLLDAHMALVLAGLLLLLVARELPAGMRNVVRVLAVATLAAVLGFVSSSLPFRAWLPGVPSSGLLPLLSGLFGAPALLEGLRAESPLPEQEPARPTSRIRRGAAMGGIAAASITCLLPGLTSSVSLAATRWGRDPDGKGFLCAQAAIGGASLVFSFGLLWVAARPRTGLAVAVGQLWPSPAWSLGAAPPPVLPVLAACFVGAALGAAVTCWLDVRAARTLARLARPATLAALLFIVALVAALSGTTGLAVFAVATLVGCLPLSLGVARLHLTACLLVPVLAYHLGLR